MIRRLAGLALMAVFAHLSVARAQLECGRDGSHPDAAATQDPHAGHTEHGGHGATGTDEGTQDSQSLPPSQCCQAMASCSVMSDAASEPSDDPMLLLAVAAVGHLLDKPAERFAAPEPPPPRA